MIAGVCVTASCSDYTPKPRGYFRIEPPAFHYVNLPIDTLPYTFNISSDVRVELPPPVDAGGWIRLHYPSWGAKIYCSYLPIKPFDLERLSAESRDLVARQAKRMQSVTERSYNHPTGRVYAMLYELGDDSASPLQFTLTDSLHHFFRGALLYDCTPNADSLAPVTDYLKADLAELIQSFSWKK